ncbi:MAG: 3-phosphoglycerate dehydrogenase [Gammaproteobacteria bacterium]|nr:3-phosphoglycerate dehydrogenase [Gammaproteobacteria bacterium]
MKKILTLNNISTQGLERLPRENYEVSSECSIPDGILLRSFKMHDMEIPESLLAVGRAGAGVNNIPLDKMSDRGIAVFNAPGANSNAVKELVVAGMLLACRNLCDAWDYTNKLEGTDAEISKAVEEGKKKYVGYELPGRTLGVIGLGAIGVRVANAAISLGMNVIGYDPGISVQSAWNLSADVQATSSVDDMMSKVDFISLHVPLIPATKNIINADRLAKVKADGVIMNFARDGIVDDEAVLAALEADRLHAYVTDFPSNLLKGKKGVINLPHLGASTGEAEENCAVMVADQIKDYLENGNVTNSVNFPEIKLSRATENRLSVVNANMPDMVGQISHILGENDLNIHHMVNESRNDIACTLMDLDKSIPAEVIDSIKLIDGVLAARSL